MTIAGVDPGQKGGIALINGQITGHRQVVHMEPMPELRGFYNILSSHDIAHVFIEKAQSMPKCGVASSFSYGRHFGELIGTLVAMKLPFTLVRPTEWTKVIHFGTDGDLSLKERTYQAMLQLYPDQNFLASPRCKKFHDGMTDALALAEFGMRRILGSNNNP